MSLTRTLFAAWFVLTLIFIAAGTGHCQMAPNRTQQIQHSLKAHGYRGDMIAALKQCAKDHGWQTKSVPDSRVLIFLGLGPKYPNLLNPRTAWITYDVAVIAKR